MAKKSTEKTELDFENTLQQLEAIVTRLESGELPWKAP